VVAWVTKALDKVRRRTLDQVGGGDRSAAVAPGGTPAGSAFAGSAGVGFDFVTDDRGFVTEPGLAGVSAWTSMSCWSRQSGSGLRQVVGMAPAPVRRFLPELIEKIWTRQINPGKVFDLTLPLEKAAEGYAAMDDRTAIKVLLQP